MSRNLIQRPCSGPSRREILRMGSLAFLGLGLDDWFRLRAAAGAQTAQSATVKNCILIWLAGGPSHLDTFDPKPAAAADVRGEFKPIDTSVAGLKISEVFPNLAKVMNQVTLIRSMTSPESDHDRASHHLLTGYRPSPALVYPGYGSVVSQDAGSEARDAAAVRGRARSADLRDERLSEPGLRPVLGIERSELSRASASGT